MIATLVVIALVWLLVLTVLFIGVVRHLGALQITGASTTAPESGFNFDTDGPWIPSPLPERAVDALVRGGVADPQFVGVFFSAGCGTCLERATEIADDLPDAARTVFLVTGNRPDALTDLRRVLEPVGARIVGDPEAHDIVKALGIQSTPFAFRVAAGQVVAKTYLRNLNDFRLLAAALGRSLAAAEPLSAGATLELSHLPLLEKARKE